MITVKDNYLTGEEHQALYNNVVAEYFPWYFNAYKVFKHEKETTPEAFSLFTFSMLWMLSTLLILIF